VQKDSSEKKSLMTAVNSALQLCQQEADAHAQRTVRRANIQQYPTNGAAFRMRNITCTGWHSYAEAQYFDVSQRINYSTVD